MKRTRPPWRIPAAALLCLAASALPAHAREAQQPPQQQQPIRFVVPYATGGLPDTVIRRISNDLAERLGQAVVVDNKPGAGGVIGAQNLLSSPVDGNTYLFSDSAFMSITPLTIKDIPYDPARDFVPVSLVARAPNFLAVHADVPARSAQEFITLAKSRPNQINCGSSGIGTLHHLTLESMKRTLEIEVVHVPFKGSGQSVPALAGGQTQCALAALPSIIGFAKNGRIRILAVAGGKASPLAPEVPPLYPGKEGQDFAFLLGVVAKKGTPAESIERLSAALAEVVKRPAIVESLQALGVDPIGGSPQAYGAALAQDAQQMATAAKLAGIGMQ